MFGKIFEIGSLMKQAHEFTGKIQEMNENLRQVRVQGTAGGGLVTVHLNGMQEMTACSIDPTLFKQEDAELMEELVMAATNDAVDKSRQRQAELMQGLSEGMDLGSLGESLGKMLPK